MHDTPPGRPHGPEPDAGPDDALVGELRELMERAAAGLAPLPDLTQEAVRLGRLRRIRARLAVVGAVVGVLAVGGIGSVAFGGLGSAASQPVSPAAAPPSASRASAVPSPAPSMTAPTPVASASEDAVRGARTAEALTRALGDLIGTVTPDGADRFAGRLKGHIFPVTFQVMPGGGSLAECSDLPETATTCSTALLPDGSEVRVIVSGDTLWGGQSFSVSYRYAESTVNLTVTPDADAKVSPPVTVDQLVAAAGTKALLTEVKYQAQYAAEATADSSDEASDSPSSPASPAETAPATAEPSTAEPSLASDPTGTDSTSETGGSSR
ncbi:hypothetical protein [Streptomyces sp. GQFP]|uniref:hypothetical protein n=1 Tax=Streptomyces sp. GQFP TaxID=2907545 RepID=UPI001F23596F|nr:hypothetical protein [Streptomyces sp. GQFP]UIX31404.1 hypothetical protein LUX31_15940 [Streptomyces sp. GQFP]